MSDKKNQENPLQESRSIANRFTVSEFVKKLSSFEIISFDVFDTLILRTVNDPKDVFTILAVESGFNDFKSARITAEKIARERMQASYNTREVNIYDIYDVLYERYAIDRKWMLREIELEKQICVANPYFLAIYQQLITMNKKIIVMTDMYLPKNVIEDILDKCGYHKFYAIFVSNEIKKCKGDGSLPKYINETLIQGKRAIHIGDNYTADIRQTRVNGFQTSYYPSVHEAARPYQDVIDTNLSSVFYRGVLNNSLHCGCWDHSLHYEHGFKVGGILTYGFCKYVDDLCKQKSVDLILFCARDCEIISKVYKKYFNNIENKYIAISRFALFMASPERYLYDLLNRSIRKMIKEAKVYFEIGNALRNIGLDYLLGFIEAETDYVSEDLLTNDNIEVVCDCILNHKNDVVEHNLQYTEAAAAYFKEKVFGHKNILVVDVGWSGTCITALKYLFEKELSELNIQIDGALMFANNNMTTACSCSDGTLNAYVCDGGHNKDILALQNKRADINNLCLEYLFSSASNSLLYYSFDKDHNVVNVVNNNIISNKAQIDEIHAGIMDFIGRYKQITKSFEGSFKVDPYIATRPFYKSLESVRYIREIYSDFVYDAVTSSYSDKASLSFGDYLDDVLGERKLSGKILLISHEFSYTGAPHSLLRIAKVIKKLGCYVEVWGPKKGEFLKEFDREKIRYRIVPARDMERDNNLSRLMQFDMCIINTILADEYYAVIRKYLPAVWYIREATNIPFCCKSSATRMQTLKKAEKVYCVSEYAANYIKKYNKNVCIVNNCVEDVSNLADPYFGPQNGIVKFIQLGTIEERKGYDLIVEAYDRLPENLKNKVEFYFAGQLRPGFQSVYWQGLLEKIKGYDKIHYIGEIKDETLKAKTISQMDVVIVASRDEACSLVALEGAMFSKPLLLSSNVGAKYMVKDGNGVVFESDNVENLTNSIVFFVKNVEKLTEMGKISRLNYDKYASMSKHESDIENLLRENMIKNTDRFKKMRDTYCKECNSPLEVFKRRARKVLHYYRDNGLNATIHFINSRRPKLLRLTCKLLDKFADIKNYSHYKHYKRKEDEIIASLTSYPKRIDTVGKTIQSIMDQYLKADQVWLVLSKQQFPSLENDLPDDLLKLRDKGLVIKWVEEDLKPHKKYFYVMEEKPKSIIITFDDDVIYDKDIISTLYESYLENPTCVSCMRAHRLTMKKGKINKYQDWVREDNSLYRKATHYAVATGVGGVLYPPNAFGEKAFDKSFIIDNCVNADDLWLKAMEVEYDRKVILAARHRPIKLIDGTQETALYVLNVFNNENDVCMQKIIQKYPQICEKIADEK